MNRMSKEMKIKLLNGDELIEQRKLYEEVDGEFLIRGVKATFPTNSEEEQSIIKSYQGIQLNNIQNSFHKSIVNNVKTKKSVMIVTQMICEKSYQWRESHRKMNVRQQ